MLEKHKFKHIAGWPDFNMTGPFCLGYILRMEMGFSYLVCKPHHQKISNQSIEMSVQAGHIFGIQILSRLHPFLNETHILRMLYLYALGDGVNSSILRDKSDFDIRDELAFMLERQELVMLEIENPWGKGRYTPYVAPEKQQKPKESAPILSAPTTTWVDISLVNEAGEPIANQEYVVKAAGGLEFTGQTDAKGQAHILGVMTGLCDVSFKGLEGWHPEGTSTDNDEPIETTHTVAEGETLADIAQQYGYHSWQTIYNHDANKGLRELRKKPSNLHSGDEVHIPKMENIVASARSDQLNEFVLKRLNLKVSNLTIKMIADELKRIESETSYENARFAAKQLDYFAVCDLVHALGKADNNPNLMPSRFMLLPEATDEELDANGNLDNIPWPVHVDGPQKLSVDFLKHCLALTGYYELSEEEELPKWYSEPAEILEDEFGNKSVDEEDQRPAHNSDGNSEFDDKLFESFKAYLAEHGVKTELQEHGIKEQSTHVVKQGESLHQIAQEHGYPYWQMLQEANELDNPDILEEGSEIILPAINAEAMQLWLEDQDEHEDHWTQQGYFFPANYTSMSLVDYSQKPLSEGQYRFEAYNKQQGHLFYDLAISKHDEVFVMLPNGDDIGIGYEGITVKSDLFVIENFSDYLSKQITEDPNPELYDDTLLEPYGLSFIDAEDDVETPNNETETE